LGHGVLTVRGMDALFDHALSASLPAAESTITHRSHCSEMSHHNHFSVQTPHAG